MYIFSVFPSAAPVKKESKSAAKYGLDYDKPAQPKQSTSIHILMTSKLRSWEIKSGLFPILQYPKAAGSTNGQWLSQSCDKVRGSIAPATGTAPMTMTAIEFVLLIFRSRSLNYIRS
ncbi:MAG: hypothetical protein AMJ65_01820 [Phycisphaerae bacterium SG8_4]|nr:MAG: hypothetical protein AMJ65_01820 [Phycisphaerae bacterium SG8_4]